MEPDRRITVIRSRRKTLQVEVTANCSVIVRAPSWVPRSQIDDFVKERQDWIDRTIAKMQKRIDETPVLDRYSEHELAKLTEDARAAIPPLVKKYAEQMGLPYGRVTIRAQKTLWGSCSAKGNLNFNCLLMLLPEPVMEYVIIHELCHIRELNHSDAFWKEVEKYCSDYKYLRRFLKENGEKLMLRM